MKVGAFYFPTDYGIDICRAGARARGARLRIAVRVRAHAHPRQPAHAVPRRRRAAQALLPHARSVRGAVVRRRGDQEAQARHRHLPRSRSAIRSSPPSRSRASTSSPAGASSSPWAAAGTSRRWRTTARKYDTRFKLLRERVLAMKELWTKEEAEFHGEFVNFDPVWSYPKPKQQPASADPARRRERPHLEARGGVLRRLVPAPARRLGAQERGGAPEARRPRRAGAIPRRCRSPCSPRRPMRPSSRPTARPASTACCSRCRTCSRDEILGVLDKNAPLTKS